MTPHGRYVLRLADTNLVLAQRLGEWVGHAPALEEDLGLANVSLDLLGQARLLLAHAGQLEGRGRGEDELAFLREESEFYNLTLVEQPNGDFGDTIVRQFLFDAWQLGLYEALRDSKRRDARRGRRQGPRRGRVSPALQRRMARPARRRHGREPRARRGFARCGCGPTPANSSMTTTWTARRPKPASACCRPRSSVPSPRASTRPSREATLARPAETAFHWYGKQGRHSEHLGYLLAEMQSLHRAHPGATW